MSVTYFAYGANLDADAMQLRCPGAVTLVSARTALHSMRYTRIQHARHHE